jgi:hypothetical protein
LSTGEAVHSRHSIIGNRFTPSQHRGTCTSHGTAGTP